MNIGKILLQAGEAVVSAVVPGGAQIISLVNSLLPPDQQLHPNATGNQAQAAVDTLPPDQKAAVLMKDMDVQIAESKDWSGVVASLAVADGPGSSTRPQIAEQMAHLVIGVTLMLALAMGWVCIQTGVLPSWEEITALLALPTVLLRAYFGLRTDEKKARYAAASGAEVLQGGTLSNLLKQFTGK